jgi:hypothetical protein
MNEMPRAMAKACDLDVFGRSRADFAARLAIWQHRCRNRDGTPARLARYEVCHGRRLRASRHRLFDLPLLVNRCNLRGGRRDEAREMFVDAIRLRNRYGLLSEDVHPVTGEVWGNVPQTCAMPGLIQSAMKLSRSWGDRYWRGSS